jgi:hypothetical protein
VTLSDACRFTAGARRSGPPKAHGFGARPSLVALDRNAHGGTILASLNRMRSPVPHSLLAAILLAGCGLSEANPIEGKPNGGKPNEARTTAKVEPQADALLKQMSNSLAQLNDFQFDADHVLEVVKTDGEVLQFVAKSRVAVARPNKVRSDRLGAIADVTLFYDGAQMTIFGNKNKMYAQVAAPATLDEAIDFGRDKLGVEAPAADMLYADVYTGLMADVTSGTYIGNEPLGNRMCHHLAYRSNQTDWQIWVEDSPRALPCRYVITSKKVKGEPQFEVSFDNWTIPSGKKPADFQFTAPAGSTKIDFVPAEQMAKKKGAKT